MLHSVVARARLLASDLATPRETRTAAAIVLRASTPDSDTLPLLRFLGALQGIERVYLVAEDAETTRHYLDRLEGWGAPALEIVTPARLWQHLSSLRVAFTTGNTDLQALRLWNTLSPKRHIYRLFHGPVTKATGSVKTIRAGWTRRWRWKHIQKHVGIEACIVQSSVEKWYRSVSYGIHHDRLKTWGYPRFYRAAELRCNPENAAISREARALLDRYSGMKKILYAPTHGKDTSPTFMGVRGYDATRMAAWLDANEAMLIIRGHVNDAMTGWRRHEPPGRVIHLPPEAVPGAVELMPWVDCVLTDYSSIFAESLACNTPTVFIHDAKDPFLQRHGLAYEEELALPGPRVATMTELEHTLGEALRGRVCNEIGVQIFRLRTRQSMWDAYRPMIEQLGL